MNNNASKRLQNRSAICVAGAAIAILCVMLIISFNAPQEEQTGPLLQVRQKLARLEQTIQDIKREQLELKMPGMKGKKQFLRKYRQQLIQDTKDWCKNKAPMFKRPHVCKMVSNFHPKHPVEFKQCYYKDNDIVSDIIAASGAWEGHTVREIHEALDEAPADSVFVDVGANLGYFVNVAASRGNTVFAFEAFEENVELIRMGICGTPLEDRVIIHPFGLGERNSSCKLVSSPNNKGDGLCLPLDAKIEPRYVFRQNVDIRMMDDYIAEYTAVVKLDIEGNELAAIKGGKQTFTLLTDTLVFEQSNQDDVPETFALLRSWGFDLYLGGLFEAETLDLKGSIMDLKAQKATRNPGTHKQA